MQNERTAHMPASIQTSRLVKRVGGKKVGSPVPALIFLATRGSCDASIEWIPAASPYEVSLAMAMASASVENLRTEATGPKICAEQRERRCKLGFV